MRRFLLFGIGLTMAAVAMANYRTVTLETEGTLSGMFTSAERETIDSLTVAGKVNYKDLKFIRSMGALIYLDLSDVNIITASPSGYTSAYSTYLINGPYAEGIDVFWFLSNDVYSKVSDKNGGFIIMVYTNDLTGFLIDTGIREYTPPRSIVRMTDTKPVLKSAEEYYHNNIWNNYYNFLPLQSETLETLHIPAECAAISGHVFANTPRLKTIDVDTANPIYDSRENCNAIIETESNTLVCGISSSIVPNSVTAIGNGAFAESAVEGITVPANVEVIASNAFANCPRLSSVVLEGTVALGDSVFIDCDALDSIALPTELEQIGMDCFYGCRNLKAVNYAGALSQWNVIDFNDTPSGFYGKIYSNPLFYAERFYVDGQVLNSLVIPAEMDVVFNTVFYGYKGLQSLVVGENVRSVGKNAFNQCDNLTMIYSAVDNPDAVYGAYVVEDGVHTNVFGDLSNTTVFVPKGMKPVYEACPTFERAKAIIETNPEEDRQIYDTNGDGMLNVGDVSHLYNVMINPSQEIANDLNDDGVTNVGDVSSLYNAILSDISFWW